MDRLENFLSTFVLSLLGYLVFIFIPYVDSIILAIYMYSLFFFLFSREEKVNNEKLLKDPRIHFYHKSRNNMHGYLVVAGAIVSIFLFYILSFNFDFRLGISVLLSWFLMLIYCIWANGYTARFVILDTVSDYMYIALDKKIETKLLDQLVAKYFYTEISEIEEKVKKDDDVPKDLKEKFSTELIKYINENFVKGDEFTSEELKEMNKKD